MNTLEAARPNELDACWEIIREGRAFQNEQGFVQWTEDYPNRETLRQDIEEGKGFVLKVDGTIAAYMCVDFNGEPAYAEIDGTWLDQAPYVVLHRLAVAQEVKGQGIATEFMRRTMTLARERGTGSFRIDTNFDNRCMLRLLAKFGFVRCGEIHYAGDPRIAFQKIL